MASTDQCQVRSSPGWLAGWYNVSCSPLSSPRLPRDLIIPPQTPHQCTPVCPAMVRFSSFYSPAMAPPHGPTGLVRRINRVGQVDMFIPTVMCILDWETKSPGLVQAGSGTGREKINKKWIKMFPTFSAAYFSFQYRTNGKIFNRYRVSGGRREDILLISFVIFQ